MKGRRRKRILSSEELELWDRVTRHDERLVRARPMAASRVPASETPTLPVPARENPSPAAVPAVPPRPGTAAKKKPASPPPPEPFDPRLSRKIARGRSEIDARLDLHGLRQQDAYAALRHFLAHCQAEGHRHVLIITGKGGSTEEFSERDFYISGQRGVLRRLVPHWLREPSFRRHVVSFTESALKHGGSGALYVTIRKAPRPRV